MVVLALVAYLAVRMAWMADDAFATLRTALNISHGWGPGFNATEAVQGYTHPLWFLVWVLLGTLTSQWVLGILIMSAALSVVAVGCVLWLASTPARVLACGALLLLSNAFMDYTTSGLEVSLSYATVGALLVLTLRRRQSLMWAAGIGLASAAVMLTRMDQVLLIAPALLAVAWAWRRSPRLLAAAGLAWAVPVAAWFAWSWATYAALLPNTFAAKRNLSIPPSELVAQGLHYVWFSGWQDPASIVVIVAAVVLAAVSGPLLLRGWAGGIALYLGYVVWVGGDFMAGRFIAVPVYVGVALLAVARIPGWGQTRAYLARPQLAGPAVVIVAVAVFAAALWGMATPPDSLANPETPKWDYSTARAAGVADERAVYVKKGLSLRCLWSHVSAECPSREITLRDVDRAAAAWPGAHGPLRRPARVEVGCAGLIQAVEWGPRVHYVVDCGLTDRFLAELPFTPSPGWRIGHFVRPLPTGYEDAVRHADPSRVVDAAERERLEDLWSRIRPAR